MRTEILLMLLAIGLGTYALRALPLIGARRLDPAGKVFRALQLLGPMLIAVLGVSVIGDVRGYGAGGWLPELLGLGATLAVQRRFGGFVAPILAGVAACAFGLTLLRSWGG
jgi:branched-subunit amino acid transport protein AzlD